MNGWIGLTKILEAYDHFKQKESPAFWQTQNKWKICGKLENKSKILYGLPSLVTGSASLSISICEKTSEILTRVIWRTRSFFDVVDVVVAVYAAALGIAPDVDGGGGGGGDRWLMRSVSNVIRFGAERRLRLWYSCWCCCCCWCWCVLWLWCVLMMRGASFKRNGSQPFIDMDVVGVGICCCCCCCGCSFDDGKIKITTIPYYIIQDFLRLIFFLLLFRFVLVVLHLYACYLRREFFVGNQHWMGCTVANGSGGSVKQRCADTKWKMNFSFARNNVVKRLRIECEICLHVAAGDQHTLIHSFVRSFLKKAIYSWWFGWWRRQQRWWWMKLTHLHSNWLLKKIYKNGTTATTTTRLFAGKLVVIHLCTIHWNCFFFCWMCTRFTLFCAHSISVRLFVCQF